MSLMKPKPENVGRFVAVTGEGGGRLWFACNDMYCSRGVRPYGVIKPGGTVFVISEFFNPHDGRIHLVGISHLGLGAMRKRLRDDGWKLVENGT